MPRPPEGVPPSLAQHLSQQLVLGFDREEEPLNFLDARISKLKSEFRSFEHFSRARCSRGFFVFLTVERGGLVAREGGSTHSARAQPTRWKREDREDAEGAMPADRIEVSRGKPFLSLSLFLSASSTRRRRRRRRSNQRSDGRRSLHSQPSRSSLALWPRGRRVPARGVPMTSS